MYKEPSEDKCDKCKERRDQGYAFCDKCDNRLFVPRKIGFKPCPGMYKYKGE